MNNGVILTRAKYVYAQEMFGIEPSIRICISANFSKKEIEKAAAITRRTVMTRSTGARYGAYVPAQAFADP
ncbi:16926_t:CDS:2 [Gigaspora rosea]|nr:16926_t:CDS:2 [Gigaspora rosea]